MTQSTGPSTDPVAQAYARYEQLEAGLSKAMDQLVATNGFAELFTTSATTVMALVRMANGAVDQAVRYTRLAAKQDVANLARQLARTEDKLERLLQLMEEIEQHLDERDHEHQASGAAGRAAEPVAAQGDPAPQPARGANGSGGSSNGTASRRRRATAVTRA